MNGDSARAAALAAPADSAAAGGAAENRSGNAGHTHPLIQDLFLHPTRWSIWPAIAALWWLLSNRASNNRRIVYRSTPTLTFSSSEITDVALSSGGVILTLEALGLAGHGSLLPTSDIERIVDDHRRGGALSMWLDAPVDRFIQAAVMARSRYQAAFSLATGGRIGAIDSAAELAGRPAPLLGTQSGRIADSPEWEPREAIGLTALFFGPVSAVGLTDLLHAYTDLPVRVREFAGDDIPILRPARVGGMFGSMLGTACKLADAGIEIVIEGGGRPDGPPWAKDARRRESLYLLARCYIGSPSPAARIALRLDAGNAHPAALDGDTALGGLAVLGQSGGPVRLPLAAQTPKQRIGMYRQ